MTAGDIHLKSRVRNRIVKILFLSIWSEMPFYRTYFGGDDQEVWHVCDPNGHRFLRTFLAEDEIHGLTLPTSNSPQEMMMLLQDVYRDFPFERVVAIDEHAVLPAAYVRDVFNIPGPRVAEVELFRDKRKMKQFLAERGIRVIRDLDPASLSAENFVPCVIKKPDGTGADGVHICRTFAEFDERRGQIEQGALLEEFVEGDFFHVDGAYNEGGFVAMPHAYINTCYDHYIHSAALGSYGVDDPELKERLLNFARETVATLPLREGVFHLEIIRTPQDELIFLEIASRVGGGEIYRNFVDAYNFDLIGFHIQSQLGLAPPLRELRKNAIAGWLMINDFEHVPGIYAGVRCGTLREDNCMYSMWQPRLGRRVNARQNQLIKFSLRGTTSAEVRDSILELIDNVSVLTLPLPEDATAAPVAPTAMAEA